LWKRGPKQWDAARNATNIVVQKGDVGRRKKLRDAEKKKKGKGNEGERREGEGGEGVGQALDVKNALGRNEGGKKTSKKIFKKKKKKGVHDGTKERKKKG